MDTRQDKRSLCLGTCLLRLLVAASIVAGIVAFTVLSISLSQRIDELKSAARDNIQWTYSQFEVDFLKLRLEVVSAVRDDKADLSDLRKLFDIYYSRASVVRSLDLADAFGHDSDQHPDLSLVTDFLEKFTPVIDGDDAALRAALPAMQSGLEALSGIQRAIAVDTIKIAAAHADDQRRQVVDLLKSVTLLALLVAAAFFAVIVVLLRQKQSLNQKTSEVERGNARLASTLQASLDAVVVLDKDVRIIDFSGSAEDIFGHSRAEALGKDYIDFLTPEGTRNATRDRLRQYLLTGQSEVLERGRFERQMLHADGHEFTAELSIALAENQSGQIFIAYIRDITEKLEREKQLLIARDEALSAYREKSRFFAVMSHEMRTPLNGLVSALELLGDTELSVRQRKFLSAANTSSNILMGHINDVLDIERIESGALEANLAPFDLNVMVENLLTTVRPLADDQNIKLHVVEEGWPDGLICSDERSLTQVLLNLISNAIKFTPSGDVTLKIAAGDVRDNVVNLAFYVTDTGTGIAEEQQSRVFEDFVTLDSAYERHATGTGLGLGIARRLAAVLGGDLKCESTLGEGSTFYFDIDVGIEERSDGPRVHESAGETQAAPVSPLQILVVEDNEINRELLCAMLENMGHRTDCASNGFEGVHRASKKHYDVILMDISMPDMNGVRATELIRRSRGLSSETPIYAVTAHALPEERRNFIEAGMADILIKPIDRARLTSLLETARKDCGGSGRAEAPASVSQRSPAIDMPFLDRSQIIGLKKVFDAPVLSRKIAAFADEVDAGIAVLSGTSDTREIQEHAHKLAGSTAIFGATRLHRHLNKIEAACKSADEADIRVLTDELTGLWLETSAMLNAEMSSLAQERTSRFCAGGRT